MTEAYTPDMDVYVDTGPAQQYGLAIRDLLAQAEDRASRKGALGGKCSKLWLAHAT